MLTGTCHCKEISFEVGGAVHRISNCHCEDCRKISGATFNTALVVDSKAFRIIKGEEKLTSYESSPGKFRLFCRICSSPIYARMDYKPEVVIIRAGLVNEPDRIVPGMHIWIKARAPWYQIHDDLPQFEEGFVPK